MEIVRDGSLLNEPPVPEAAVQAADGRNLARAEIHPRELGDLPRERVQEADRVGGFVEQGEEALLGDAELVVAVELEPRELRLDALPGGDVEEAAPVAASRAGRHGLGEHDPPARVEAAIQAAPGVDARTSGRPSSAASGRDAGGVPRVRASLARMMTRL
ncbi:hypothetical protein PVAP13_2KG502910 [Panicum virgatum]|uniref:Uncharacterized protein n=1 Tax=Panicum virgatum TaxID=38727 RepID=A0A8T0WMG0_PANVG|nr:hypothetical protein PVAP13_2KG502910 [Panicum virgatum]